MQSKESCEFLAFLWYEDGYVQYSFRIMFPDIHGEWKSRLVSQHNQGRQPVKFAFLDGRTVSAHEIIF